MSKNLSIILPAKNEAKSLEYILTKLVQRYPDAEIIVVNDASEDNTSEICAKCGVIEVEHPVSMGNGAAIKSGSRRSTGDILVFMDADGQHDPADIEKLLKQLDDGYAMCVGARDYSGQASIARWFANTIYNKLSSWITGHKIKDLTSGFRAARADKFRRYLYLLPNGFSYPTTITMAFFRSGFPVCYVPIKVEQREGDSHISPVKDGIRFFLIIFKLSTLYSPLKIYFPISLLTFSFGLANYIYTFVSTGRFTNMSALFLMIAVVIFLMGLLSEQITNLMYMKEDKD